MWVFECQSRIRGVLKCLWDSIRGVYVTFSQDPKTYFCLMSVVELVIAPDF
jgi:hypothetical protein